MTGLENTVADSNMPPLELTVIVAATSKMGIGRAGTLPWTGLKKEMAYFARVTKRANLGVRFFLPRQWRNIGFETYDGQSENLVIMGRKTWDSIPPRFRPLKDRVNVVVTRGTEPEPSDKIVRVGSFESAIKFAREDLTRRTFVIGGAQIYKEALQREETKRILLTRVLSDFECDTFFPVPLNEDGKSEGEGWERKSKEELDQWVGEAVADGVQEENGTRYVFEMWERP